MDGINPLFNATATAKRTALLTAAAAIPGGAVLLATGHGSATDRTIDGDRQIDAKSFQCLTKMTLVRHFYVDNLRGHLDATLAAANSPTGAVYPPGSVIQLVPGEAMVKRDQGFNATTHGLGVLRA